VGDPIVALGSPFGYGGTASSGIISAIRGRFVQFSAPVSPGSSGGPVLDAQGEVVAVTAAKVVGRGVEGLSFAIPIDRVCRVTAAC
jgi:S1-C subfamily serine protease